MGFPPVPIEPVNMGRLPFSTLACTLARSLIAGSSLSDLRSFLPALGDREKTGMHLRPESFGIALFAKRDAFLCLLSLMVMTASAPFFASITVSSASPLPFVIKTNRFFIGLLRLVTVSVITTDADTQRPPGVEGESGAIDCGFSS